MVRSLSFAVLLLLVASHHAIAANPTIRLEKSPDSAAPQRFVLAGLPAEFLSQLRTKTPESRGLQDLFRVYAVTNGETASSAMLGDCELSGETIVFVPRYPLRPGMTYRAIFEPPVDGGAKKLALARLEHDVKMPSRPRTAAARLTDIFPSGDVLPENLLRFYLHFSAPMSRGEAYSRIHLLNDQGKPVESPFLELAEELWSPDGCRFTLYFEPGRIKRGLQPRELFGPVLVEGRTYTLVVDAKWLDANGEPLAASVTKKFQVAAPDDKQPDPMRWKIEAPRAGTHESLVVEFDEPLDSAMLQRVLNVQDSNRQPVRGTIQVEDDQRCWLFEPAQAWQAGDHRLVVSSALEDLAGNSIGRPFEVDVLRPANPKAETATVELPFRVAK